MIPIGLFSRVVKSRTYTDAPPIRRFVNSGSRHANVLYGLVTGFCVFISVCPAGTGESVTIGEKELAEMLRALPDGKPHVEAEHYLKPQKGPEALGIVTGCYFGHACTLLGIREKYPDLGSDTVVAEQKFMNTYGAAIKQAALVLDNTGMKNQMLQLWSKEWKTNPRFKKMCNLSREDAVKYIATVRKRALGAEIPPKVKAALVGAHPLVYDKPAVWGLDQFSTQWSSKDHKKACGMDLRIRAPSHWTRKEGERPHMLQKWSHRQKNHMLIFIVGVEDAGKRFSEAEAKILFDNKPAAMELLKNMAAGGAKVRYREVITGYGNRPVLVADLSMDATRGGFRLVSRGEMYLLVDGRHFVSVLAMAVRMPEKDAPMKVEAPDFDRFRAGFRAILNRIDNFARYGGT